MPVSDWMAGRPIDILLIEDDADDVLLTREMFTDYKVSNRLTAVDNGRDALALLTRTGRYVDANDQISSCSISICQVSTAVNCWSTSVATRSSRTFRWWC